MQSCLICDDHQMMREALVGCLRQAYPDAAIAEAGDFPAAWTAAAMGPDLILCDLGMPGASPLDGIAGVQRAAPGTPILVITANEEDDVLIALFEAGIAGFLPKTSGTRIIDAAVRLILSGGRYVPQRLIALAVGKGGAAPAPSVEEAAASRLTPRQIDVLDQMARGQTNKEIAREFNISPATVKAHAMAAFMALDVSTRAEAVYKAQRLGLIG